MSHIDAGTALSSQQACLLPFVEAVAHHGCRGGCAADQGRLGLIADHRDGASEGGARHPAVAAASGCYRTVRPALRAYRDAAGRRKLVSWGIAGERAGGASAPHIIEPDVGPLHRAELLPGVEAIGIEGVPEANRRQVALRHVYHSSDTITLQRSVTVHCRCFILELSTRQIGAQMQRHSPRQVC